LVDPIVLDEAPATLSMSMSMSDTVERFLAAWTSSHRVSPVVGGG
jgi:hypothetical protein